MTDAARTDAARTDGKIPDAASPGEAPAPSHAGGASRIAGIVRADLVAGLTVAALSLPQSMAYALVAGVDPRFGLYTAIVFTAVAAIFGSSRHLINGPTGAVSLVVFSALAIFDPQAQLDAFEAMFPLAIMIGAVQIFIAVTRLGDLTAIIQPEPVALAARSTSDFA